MCLEKKNDNWKIYKLIDIIKIIGGGTPKTNIPEYWDGDVPWLTVNDFNKYEKHVFKTQKKISKKGLEHSSTKILKRGQIIISARGTVGALAQLARDMAFNQTCYGIIAREEYTNNDFIFYLLKRTVSQFKKISHGAIFDTITRETFKHIEVKLPPLSEQKAIAHILGTLDDKIELNRSMNETLEAMAKAIFKSWFVDFDPVKAKKDGKETGLPGDIDRLFPSSFEDSELGPIPKGWKVSSIYNVANYINGAAYRNIDFSNDRLGKPIIKIAELKNGISSSTRFTNKELDPKYRIENGDILFSWSGSPDTSIDIFIWTLGSAWLNQHIYKVIPEKKEYHYFTYYLLKYYRRIFIEIARNKQTTGLGHVTTKDMKNLKTSIPSLQIIDIFNKKCGPFFEQFYNLKLEMQYLANLRDALLPKLISGEIRIPEAEKFIENI